MGSDDSEAVGKTTNGSSQSQVEESAQQEQLIADHEATHGPLPKRILAELRAGAQQAGAVGTKTGGQLVGAAEELRLEVVETQLEGKRALGHAEVPVATGAVGLGDEMGGPGGPVWLP